MKAEQIEAINKTIRDLNERIERMQELQIPLFVVDRERRKVRDLTELLEKENDAAI